MYGAATFWYYCRYPLLDWIEKGANSRYIWDVEKVATRIIARTPEQDKAEPAFKLGNHFHDIGSLEKADIYWGIAQELSPDNINYFREELSYTEEGSMGETYRKKRVEMREAGKDYYRPLELDN
ncbi:hypothetical protein [Aurantivibrio infirmus]